jgi:hypothetical protein
MTSIAPPLNNSATALVDSRQAMVRLTLKPAGAAKGFFDGGWWPHSWEPVAEFSALVEALPVGSGPVERISFNLTSWDTAPRRLVVQDRMVRLEGFHSTNPNTVTVIGPHLDRLTLLVVPPGAPADAAQRALMMVAAGANVDDAARIFAASGALRSDSVSEIPDSRRIDHRAEDSWDTDGGRVHARG